MTQRARLSATVEGDLLTAGREAVLAGRAESLSAWVNDALSRQAAHDRRMAALDDFIQVYEAEHGEITEAEMAEASRRSSAQAVVVRGDPPVVGRARKAKRGVA